MPTRTWRFQDEDLFKHVVTFDHGRWIRWQTVTADGVVVARVRRGLDARGSHHFTIRSHVCDVVVRSKALGYEYELQVDGRPIPENGAQLVSRVEAPLPVASVTAAPAPRYQSALSWLYWISGATLVNAVLYHAGSSVMFPVGATLGFLSEGVVLALGEPFGWIAHPLIALGFWLIARRVRAGSSGALKLAIVLYGIDTALDVLVIFDPILVGLRALALWSMIRVLRTAPSAPTPAPAT
jgi:FAIM1 (Fas apoptotic inhibitory molecule) protein